jgi:non-heme chloroperoxidase
VEQQRDGHLCDDVAALAEALDLKGAVYVGHSTGGGGVARYISRHGTSGSRRPS